jgi:hypothetical protein
MDILVYIRLVLWTAFRHSASLAQAIFFLVFVIIGAAIWLLPIFGMTVNASALLNILVSPKFYAILFGSVILVRLICAPYWIWKVEREARIDAESKVNKQENRKIIKVALSSFIPEAQSLMIPRGPIPPNDEVNAWVKKVEAFLLDNLDKSYFQRFHVGLPVLPFGMSLPDHSILHRSLQIRIDHLIEFIKEQ